MIVTSNNFSLKLEEILKESLPTKGYNDTEKNVLKLIRKWHNGIKNFTHTTSGSTGTPKKIKIPREKIILSAKSTMSYIDPNDKVRNSLLCLNPNHIGGAMVVYRALIFNQNIHIVEPGSNPLDRVDKLDFDLASMVPLQFENLRLDDINCFKIILVGGAPLATQSVHSTTQVYSTFGMTETVSHFALKLLSEASFHTIGDNEVDINPDGSLKIKGSITNNSWVETNDIIQLKSPNSFNWIGRKDFVINTGGIKVHPEKVEHNLASQISNDFIISSLPDERLGRKVILISSGEEVEINLSTLNKYERPKELFFNCEIIKTSNNKVDRVKTLKHVENMINH